MWLAERFGNIGGRVPDSDPVGKRELFAADRYIVYVVLVLEILNLKPVPLERDEIPVTRAALVDRAFVIRISKQVYSAGNVGIDSDSLGLPTPYYVAVLGGSIVGNGRLNCGVLSTQV